jgi:hypothetical protein
MTDFTSLSPRQRRRGSMSGSFSGSASLGNSFILGPAVTDEMDSWLDVTAEEVLKTAETETPRVTGDTGLEKATEILIKSEASCLLVETGGGFGLFDVRETLTPPLTPVLGPQHRPPARLGLGIAGRHRGRVRRAFPRAHQLL